VFYVGIDDTDIKNAPGTNKLARHLVRCLWPDYRSRVAIRHQLLFDPRIAYTSKNSSASLLLDGPEHGTVDELAGRVRRLMEEWFTPGSDPGLCVTDRVPEAITAFGRRCQQELVRQEEARHLAAGHAMFLEGLGGTEDGVIGALAAVGLAAGGDDGRVVSVGLWPDDLAGPLDVALLHARGVAEIRCLSTGRTIAEGSVDIGKHLRPNYRGGQITLFVEPGPPETPAAWRAVRLP